MAKQGKGDAYDSLLCELESASFQMGVRAFLDQHCLIFDPFGEPEKDAASDHHELHRAYGDRVNHLLRGILADLGLSWQQATKSISNFSKELDLREVDDLQLIFEQILSVDDFTLFYKMMAKWNVLMQRHAIMLLAATEMGIPSILMPGGDPTHAPQRSQHEMEEDELMQDAQKQSQREYDHRAAQMRKEEDDTRQAIALSQKEIQFLQQQEDRLSEDMRNISVSGSSLTGAPVMGSTRPAVHAAPGTSKSTPSRASAKSTQRPPQKPSAPTASQRPAAVPTSKSVSNAEAAAMWLNTAHAEAGHSDMAASYARMDMDELKERQKRLQEQRDRLIAMKKEEREKKLKDFEKSNPKRPQSARAARSALQEKTTAAKEDEDKMAMRRAIAKKLQEELIVQGSTLDAR